jgi:hypothetical protein
VPEDEKEELTASHNADCVFSFVEGCTLVVITLAIYAAVIYTVYWIIYGGRSEDTHARFVIAVAELDERWKVGLLLLLPLFYRPIRKFLLLLEQAWGLKTGPRAPRGTETKPNPPPVP